MSVELLLESIELQLMSLGAIVFAIASSDGTPRHNNYMLLKVFLHRLMLYLHKSVDNMAVASCSILL